MGAVPLEAKDHQDGAGTETRPYRADQAILVAAFGTVVNYYAGSRPDLMIVSIESAKVSISPSVV
jgi:hypothetical protein